MKPVNSLSLFQLPFAISDITWRRSVFCRSRMCPMWSDMSTCGL